MRGVLREVFAERAAGVFVFRVLAAAGLWTLVEHVFFDQAWQAALMSGLFYGLVIAVVVTFASIAFPRAREHADPPSARDEPNR